MRYILSIEVAIAWPERLIEHRFYGRSLCITLGSQELQISRFAKLSRLEQQLTAQLAELETLKNDDGLKQEIEFETNYVICWPEYGCSLRAVINILDPHAATQKGAPRAIEPTAHLGLCFRSEYYWSNAGSRRK
jgi:hypothetical protein